MADVTDRSRTTGVLTTALLAGCGLAICVMALAYFIGFGVSGLGHRSVPIAIGLGLIAGISAGVRAYKRGFSWSGKR
jgi:hypothetical protein